MPLTLVKRSVVGNQGVAYFRATNGDVHRVVISRSDYDRITSDTDDTAEYLTDSGRSIRPVARASLYKATVEIEVDTTSGFLEPGDYVNFKDTGQLHIQLERPDLSRIDRLILDPGDYTGDPSLANTINAVTAGPDGARLTIIAGVIQ